MFCTIFIHSLKRIRKHTRSLRSLVRFPILLNSWIKIVRAHFPWSNLYNYTVPVHPCVSFNTTQNQVGWINKATSFFAHHRNNNNNNNNNNFNSFRADNNNWWAGSFHVFRLVTQRCSPQTAAYIRTTFLSICSSWANEITDIVSLWQIRTQETVNTVVKTWIEGNLPIRNVLLTTSNASSRVAILKAVMFR